MHLYIKLFFQDIVLLVLFWLIGSEIGGWFLLQQFGGWAAGFLSLTMFWPIVLISSLYISAVRNKKCTKTQTNTENEIV